MATNPVTPPGNPGTLNIRVQKIDQNQAIVTVNGVNYKFTVFRDRAGAQTDVTAEFEWQEIARQATEIALGVTGKRSVDKASIVLSGIPEDPSSVPASARNVQLVSVDVEVKEGTESKRSRYTGERIPAEVEAKVKQNLQRIGEDYATIRPLSSSRVTQQEPSAPTIVDPKIEICKDRPKAIVNAPPFGGGTATEQPGLDYALAHQLSKMPNTGRDHYNNTAVEVVARDLRAGFSRHIEDSSKGYSTGEKFQGIVTSLRQAHVQDLEKLKEARAALTGTDQIDESALSNLLSAHEVTGADTTKLVKLYAKYVEMGGKVLGEIFVIGFQESHSSGANPSKFQVVVNTADGKSFLFPKTDDPIELQRCAFIYGEQNGSFLSYDRAGSATLIDLNAAGTIGSKPVAVPKPASTTPTTPPDVEVTVITDPRKEICKARSINATAAGASSVNIATTTADMALADQLKLMDDRGETKYTSKSVADIAKDLRKEVADHVGEKKGKWHEGTKFDSLFAALKKSEEKKDPALSRAVAKQTGVMTGTKMTESRLSTILRQPPDQASADEKKTLVKIYQEYLKDGGTVLDKAFFDAFIEIHSVTKKDDFQIVIIEASTDTAKHYIPLRTPSIDTRICAFLRLNADGTYSSYNRSRQGTTLPSLNDPNTVGLVPTTKTVRRKAAITSTLPLINVDSTGRCLDKSIAYQLLAKADQTQLPLAPAIATLADYLRTEAAKQLRLSSRDTDSQFFHSLSHSIGQIPDIASSHPDIATILSKRELSALASTDMQTLREFYANYITEGNMSNYLDSAFLYVLPAIPVRTTEQTAWPKGYQCAVLKGDQLNARYPDNKEFIAEDSIFVAYDGTNHYEAVRMPHLQNGVNGVADAKTQVDLIVLQQHTALLNELYARASGSSSEETKNYVLETVQVQFPKAYTALKRLVYDLDHAAWEASSRVGDEPGTKLLNYDGHDYPAVEYGDWRLHSIPADQLKQLLLTNDMNSAAVQRVIG